MGPALILVGVSLAVLSLPAMAVAILLGYGLMIVVAALAYAAVVFSVGWCLRYAALHVVTIVPPEWPYPVRQVCIAGLTLATTTVLVVGAMIGSLVLYNRLG